MWQVVLSDDSPVSEKTTIFGNVVHYDVCDSIFGRLEWTLYDLEDGSGKWSGHAESLSDLPLEVCAALGICEFCGEPLDQFDSCRRCDQENAMEKAELDASWMVADYDDEKF